MILDTSFLIDLLHRDAAALAKARELDSGSQRVLIPAPALFELWRGVHLAARGQEEAARILSVLAAYPVAPLDSAAARRGGEVDAMMIKAGTQIDPEDAMIAGIALVNHDRVLTRNTKHFSRISTLQVEGY